MKSKTRKTFIYADNQTLKLLKFLFKDESVSKESKKKVKEVLNRQKTSE